LPNLNLFAAGLAVAKSLHLGVLFPLIFGSKPIKHQGLGLMAMEP
jgi:hypothetical protein